MDPSTELSLMSQFMEAAMEFMVEYPERATQEMRRTFHAFQQTSMVRGPEATADCRHCHEPIQKVHGRWVHVVGNVGCRAASWNRLDTWDDSLDRKWKAQPPR